jgi:hypothetical protein
VISAKPYIESLLRARDSSFVPDSFEGLDRPAAVWVSDDPSSDLRHVIDNLLAMRRRC